MVIKDWLQGIRCQVLQGSLDSKVTEVIYDSRKACPGAVFVCIKGANADSHLFCSQVYQAGVRVFILERPIPLPEDATAILVENGREALAFLSAARFGFPSRKMVMIGITGTKGKTTTAHMIKTILESCGQKTGMIGTNGVSYAGLHFPTVNTTPESYLLHQYFSQMAEAGCRYVVMEVSSQAFKMHRTDGIIFDYGVFTNISPDHIGPNEHEDFEEYLYYKSMLFKQSRMGIINQDDEHAERIAALARCPLMFYRTEGEADFFAEQIRYVTEPKKGFVGLEFLVKGRYHADIRLNMPGYFNVSNALAAVSVCSFFPLPKEKVCHALEQIKVNGRMEIAYTSDWCTVIIDYAHNAVSMESLLNTLRSYQPIRLVVVFGCGGNRSKDRRYAMGEIAGKMADLSILTADNSRYEQVEDILSDIKKSLEPTGGEYMEIPDRRDAIIHAVTHAKRGDMIAIIGKGHEDYQEVNGVRTHFLDREVVDEAVSELEAKQERRKMDGISVFELAQAAKGRILCGNPSQKIRYISTNSKEVQIGDLFVPLIGAKTDAHDYIAQALEAGAEAVLTSEHDQAVSDKAWIRVNDTKKALQDIGAWYRDQLDLPIIGITGSVGKTTTREMIALALQGRYQLYKTPGNRNSQIGVPISVCEISKEDELGILELGISEPGEMHNIAMVAKLNQAVVTNIGEAHIGQLGSKENICREKLHIQDGMKEGGILFINGDDPILKNVEAKAGCRKISYGRGENCDYRVIDIRKEDGYPVFTVLHQKSKEKAEVKLSVFGDHMIADGTAAIAVARENGVPMAEAARAVALFNGLPGRQQVLKGRGITIINDSYNASPASMKAGIAVLCDVPAKAERIAVLADMKELGEEEIAYHREIGSFLAGQPVDQVVLLGELAKEIGKQMEEDAREQIQSGRRKPPVYFSDKEAMTDWLKKEQKPGDILLLKGSNAMGLGKIASLLLS